MSSDHGVGTPDNERTGIPFLRKRSIIQILRIIVLYLLFSGYYLYLKDLVSIFFWTTAFLSGAVIAFFVTPRFRFIPALLVFILGLVLTRLAGFFIFTLVGSPGDFLYLSFDINFIPLLFPLTITWLFTYWSLREPRFTKWEIILNGWLLLLLFWSQGHYDFDLLSHPVFLAGGVAVFLLIEVSILLLSGEILKRGRRRVLIPFYILLFIILLAGLFVFMGRYSRGAVSQGGGLVKPTLFRFDFSRYVNLESEINMSSDLVLLFREDEPGQHPLLRRYILSGYNRESGFFMDNSPGEPPQIKSIPDERTLFPDPGWDGRGDVYQEYFFVNFDPDSLIAMNEPVEIIPMESWDTSSFIRNYRVRSRVSEFLTWELIDSESEEMDAGFIDYYTDYGEDEKILELAMEITGDLENRYDRVMAIQMFLMENYFYSLKPGVSDDGNQLHHFLFKSKKGYCSYYAFSMALMCRSLGIPARVAVGFFVDSSLGVMNIYPVRSDMAHAWVEIFFPGYGWINFDPTSQNLASGEDFQFGGMEMPLFLSLVEEILANQDNSESTVDEGDESNLPERWGETALKIIDNLLARWPFVILFLWIFIILLGEVMPRLKCALVKEPFVKMKYEFYIFSRKLAIFGMQRVRNESYLEWAGRLESDKEGEISGFIRLYLKSLYGYGFSLDDFRRAVELNREVSRIMSAKIGWKVFGRYLLLSLRRSR